MRLRAPQHDPPGARRGLLAGAAQVLFPRLDRPPPAPPPQPAYRPVADPQPLLPPGRQPGHPPADVLLTTNRSWVWRPDFASAPKSDVAAGRRDDPLRLTGVAGWIESFLGLARRP